MHEAKERRGPLPAGEPQGHDTSRGASTKRSTLKLTGRWPAWLMVAALVVTTGAMGGLVSLSLSDRSSATGTPVPFYLAGAAVIFWIVTLSLLRRWRSADRTEHRQIVTRCNDLTQRGAALRTDIEKHKAAQQESDKLLKTREQTIREYELQARELSAEAERALAGEGDARANDRAKSEYLVRMSGEIRAPLTTILGFATTLLKTGDLSKAPPERVEALYTIKQKGEQLLDTIDDTLELCEIELQECQVNRRCGALVEIVDQVYHLMVGWAEARGLQLLVDYQGQVPESINTDPERLSQILVNLLGNSVKFTLSGDVRLRISLVRDDPENPQLCFEVVDSGIGMHEDQSGRLFGGFASAASDADYHPRSAGLGLTISKRYAEMLGGDIVVLDTLPGIGTRMRLTIGVGSLEGVKMVQPPHIHSEEDQASSLTQRDDQPEEDIAEEAREAAASVTKAAVMSETE